MGVNRTIRVWLLHRFDPLITPREDEGSDWTEIEGYEGVIADIFIAIQKHLNVTFETMFQEEEMWDMKVYPHVISYRRSRVYEFSAELYYTKVLMFSQISTTNRGSFLSNIVTIPTWFLGLLFGAILILSALTKHFERSSKFGSYVWMYLASVLLQSSVVKVGQRISAYLHNIWAATLVMANIVLMSYISADVLIGEKVVINHLRDMLRVENLKYGIMDSDAMKDFFKDLKRYLENVVSREDDIYEAVKLGQLLYINWYEELDAMKNYCWEAFEKNESLPMFYQSPFIVNTDSVAILMRRNHRIDKDTLEGINRIIRLAASSCLCDKAIEKKLAWMNRKCVTTKNTMDNEDFTFYEKETRLLINIYICSLVPACFVLMYEMIKKKVLRGAKNRSINNNNTERKLESLILGMPSIIRH